MICSQCGKKIKMREPYYCGILDGKEYEVHPECLAEFVGGDE
jgi:hypothetical protein